MSEKYVAGIDIGETKIAVALAAGNGETIFRERFSTCVERSAGSILKEIYEKIEKAVTTTEGGKLAAIGIGCAVRERLKILPAENIRIVPAEMKEESGICGALAAITSVRTTRARLEDDFGRVSPSI